MKTAKYQAIEYLIEGDYYDVLSVMWGDDVKVLKAKMSEDSIKQSFNITKFDWSDKDGMFIGTADDGDTYITISTDDGKAEKYLMDMLKLEL